MIWQIAKKDFLSNIISHRFIIGFLLCLFLIPFSLIINIDEYNDRVRLYNVDKTNMEKTFKEVRVYSKLRPEIFKPPEPLSIFCQGISGSVGNRVKIWLGDKPLLASGETATQDNPLLSAFFSMDFISIITIVMALLALIFSYDICTREKEEGTLKLKLSNSISRSQVLLGKVAGVYLTLLPILVFCFLLSMIIILFSNSISFSAHNWSRIVLLFFAALIYLSIFIFFGLFISTRFKSSITSIIICLFFWVFFVFIVPNLSVYLAESFFRVQSQDSLTHKIDDLESEFEEKSDEYSETLEEPDWNMNWNYSGDLDGGQETYGCSKSRMEWLRLNNVYSEPLRIDYADKKWAFQKSFLESLNGQRKFADRLSLISPAALFRKIASSVCYTDFESHQRFMERTREYREEFIRFLENKQVFSSYIYFTAQPPESFLTGDETVRKRTGGEFQTLQELEAWNAKLDSNNWILLFEKLSKVPIPGSVPEEYDYLDISDAPVFQWQEKQILSGIGSSIHQIGLIIIGSVLLFYLSFLGFIRYDVR